MDLREDARKSAESYVARDLAHAQGISRSMYANLPGGAREAFEIRAAAAVRGFLDWACTNTPEAIQPLRDAGFLIWSYRDGFGPGHGRKPGDPATEGHSS
jgi:hypothetical protein